MSDCNLPAQEGEITQLPGQGQATSGEVDETVQFKFNLGGRCPFCSSITGLRAYLLGTYPEPPLESPLPGIDATHTTLCRICGERIWNLTQHWVHIPEEDLRGDPPLHQAFTDAVEHCCFCEEPLEHPALGIDLSFKTGTSFGIDPSLHTICTGCAQIFERFLATIQDSEQSQEADSG